MSNITVKDLLRKLKAFDEDIVVECGFEGLSFYRKIEDNSYCCIGKIDFGNEKERNQQIIEGK
jgi:hypothetical protein